MEYNIFITHSKYFVSADTSNPVRKASVESSFEAW